MDHPRHIGQAVDVPSVELAITVRRCAEALERAARMLDDPEVAAVLEGQELPRTAVLRAAFPYVLVLGTLTDEFMDHAARWERESLPREIPDGYAGAFAAPRARSGPPTFRGGF